jgi:hypothetical protein
MPYRRQEGEKTLFLLIFELGTRGVSGQLHAPAALYHRGKDPRYPLDGLHSRSRQIGYGKNNLSLAGIEPQSSNLYSDTTMSELTQLLVVAMYHVAFVTLSANMIALKHPDFYM